MKRTKPVSSSIGGLKLRAIDPVVAPVVVATVSPIDLTALPRSFCSVSLSQPNCAQPIIDSRQPRASAMAIPGGNLDGSMNCPARRKPPRGISGLEPVAFMPPM